MFQLVGQDLTSGSLFCQWVVILPVGLDFASGSWYGDIHGPVSLLYDVIYTQPWHNSRYPGCTTGSQHLPAVIVTISTGISIWLQKTTLLNGFCKENWRSASIICSSFNYQACEAHGSMQIDKQSFPHIKGWSVFTGGGVDLTEIINTGPAF